MASLVPAAKRASEHWPRAIALAVITTLGAGCGKSAAQLPPADAPDQSDSGSTDAPPVVTPLGNGGLRFMNAAPLAGPVDIYLAGQITPIFSGVAYGLTSAQIQIPAGKFRLDVRTAGVAPTSSPSYTSDELTLATDGSITAVTAGLATADDKTNTFRIITFDDKFAVAAAGKTRVRIVNADHTQLTMAVDIGDDGSVEVPSLARFAASDAAGIEIAAGSDLALSTRRTDASHTRIASFAVPGALLGDGADVNIVLIGLQSVPIREPLGVAAVVVPAPGKGSAQKVRPNPVLYVMAASPDAGSLDAYVGATKQFNNIAFGAIASSSVPATATGVSLSYRPAGADAATAPLASFTTPRLDLGQQYLVVLSGLVTSTTAGDALVQYVYRDDMSSTPVAAGRMRAIHAGVGVTQIDVGRFVVPGGVATWQDVPGFAALNKGETSPSEGRVMVNDANAPVSVNPTLRASDSPATFLKFGTQTAIPAGERRFGLFAGAWTPVNGQVPPRFILITASNSAPWTWSPSILSPQ